MFKLSKLLVNLLLSNSGETVQCVGAKYYLCSMSKGKMESMSNGKTKTIKHVQFGINTKRKTRSRPMFDFFNRLCHSISYDEVNNVKTTFFEVNIKN